MMMMLLRRLFGYLNRKFYREFSQILLSVIWKEKLLIIIIILFNFYFIIKGKELYKLFQTQINYLNFRNNFTGWPYPPLIYNLKGEREKSYW